MTDIESKQGRMHTDEQSFFAFLTDLRNLDTFIPKDRIEDWHSEEDRCSFSVPQVGQIQLKITKQTPHNLICIEPDGTTPFPFKFYIQMKQLSDEDTRFKLVIRADLNIMMKSMIKGPLKKGLDQIVDSLSGIKIPAKEE